MDRVAVSIVAGVHTWEVAFLFLHWLFMISLGKGSWMGMEHALGFFAGSLYRLFNTGF